MFMPDSGMNMSSSHDSQVLNHPRTNLNYNKFSKKDGQAPKCNPFQLKRPKWLEISGFRS